MAHGGRHRQAGRLAVQGLPDDPGEETRRRGVGPPRTNGDGGQANADAVDQAPPGVVGQQQLAHRLLGPVRRERGEVEVVVDDRGERRPEHGDRRAEHHPGPARGRSQGVEQVAGAVEVDPVALGRVGLGLARHHAGQVEHDVGPACGEAGRRRRVGQVGHHRLHRHIGAQTGRRVGRHHVGQVEGLDRPAGQRPLGRQPGRELAAQHAGRPRDQDPHRSSSPSAPPGPGGVLARNLPRPAPPAGPCGARPRPATVGRWRDHGKRSGRWVPPAGGHRHRTGRGSGGHSRQGAQNQSAGSRATSKGAGMALSASTQREG